MELMATIQWQSTRPCASRRNWRRASASSPIPWRTWKPPRARPTSFLRHVLPSNIADELQANGSVRPVKHEDVAIMFADFTGFTTVTSQISADELVAELNECFCHFDWVAMRHGVKSSRPVVGRLHLRHRPEPSAAGRRHAPAERGHRDSRLHPRTARPDDRRGHARYVGSRRPTCSTPSPPLAVRRSVRSLKARCEARFKCVCPKAGGMIPAESSRSAWSIPVVEAIALRDLAERLVRRGSERGRTRQHTQRRAVVGAKLFRRSRYRRIRRRSVGKPPPLRRKSKYQAAISSAGAVSSSTSKRRRIGS